MSIGSQHGTCKIDEILLDCKKWQMVPIQRTCNYDRNKLHCPAAGPALSPPILPQHSVAGFMTSCTSLTTGAVLLTMNNPQHLPTCTSKNVYLLLFIPRTSSLSLFVHYFSLFTSPMLIYALIFMKLNPSLQHFICTIIMKCVPIIYYLLLHFFLSSKLYSLMAKILKDFAM